MSSNINRSKRWILIFTGTVTSVVAILLLVTGLIFIMTEGGIFGFAIVLFGLISIWFAQREFKEYRQLKKEADEMRKQG
ncbi:hypothetical protein [Lacicoccus alkaliphilus]|uniref:Uncharacterized protein n=1 Tax=Lacicoccus alkaliphilus DSM 16010 TaxID=1123231 RepID=A0A1M7HZ17_9BACL|nr:hypothetical protein [Salinicoccus alkaliphilus]SHM33791.1 hypothetical protein SAMN02745189_01977 [Salinicoccus alkaliphilus DSM 16010]